MPDFDNDVDRLVLHVQVRVAQQSRNFLYVYGIAAIAEGYQGSRPHHLVGVAELHFECVADFASLELRQQVDQVNFDRRVLAAHACDQVGDHVLGDDVVNDGK